MSDNAAGQGYGPSPYQSTPAQVMPGWYPDPYIRNGMRWWDGRQWTQQIAASGASGTSVAGLAPSSPPPYPPAHTAGSYPTPYAGAGVTAGMQTAPFDGPSIASLVTGVLGCWVVGLPLGIIGLVRTKGHIRRGRGLAIAGIATSALWMALVGVLVIAAVVSDTSSDTDGTAGTAGTVRISMSDLRTGQCIVLPDHVPDDQYWLDSVPCSTPHNAEVYDVNDLSAATRTTPYPGDPAVGRMVDARCDTSLAVFSGSPSSVLDTFEIVPTSDDWSYDRSYVCIAVADHDVTGTLAGSG